jgi:hypothetical protein
MARQHEWARTFSLWKLHERTQFEPVFPASGQPLGSAGTYRSLNETEAQYKNCPFGFHTRIQPKNITATCDSTDTIFSQNIPAKCHYCRVQLLYFGAQS